MKPFVLSRENARTKNSLAICLSGRLGFAFFFAVFVQYFLPAVNSKTAFTAAVAKIEKQKTARKPLKI
jgi:hypothetical protein